MTPSVHSAGRPVDFTGVCGSSGSNGADAGDSQRREPDGQGICLSREPEGLYRISRLGLTLLDHGKAGFTALEAVSVDSELSYFRVECRPGNPQHRRCSRWSRYQAAACSESVLDHRFLSRCKIISKWKAERPPLLRYEPRLIDGKLFAVARDYSPLNYVLQFTDVARPPICPEQIQSSPAYRRNLLPKPARTAINQIFR